MVFFTPVNSETIYLVYIKKNPATTKPHLREHLKMIRYYSPSSPAQEFLDHMYYRRLWSSVDQLIPFINIQSPFIVTVISVVKLAYNFIIYK